MMLGSREFVLGIEGLVGGWKKEGEGLIVGEQQEVPGEGWAGQSLGHRDKE